MFETNFTMLDWAIIAGYLLFIAGVGLYVNRHVHESADYLVGGRSAGTALSVASFIGTGLGLVTVVYASLDAFHNGFSYLAIALLDLAAAFLLGITGFGIAKLRELNLVTITEYFEVRYNRGVRVTAGILCALAGILNMGLFPKMGATFITYASGLGGENPEVLINIMSTGLILLVLVYTVSGGMVAIIITDYLQFVLLSLGLGLGLYFCMTNSMIGWDRIVDTLASEKGEMAFNPFHENSYGWTYLLWQACLVSAAALCWAPEASRALTTEDVVTTKRTFYLGSSGFFARLALPALWGVAAFCFVTHSSEFGDFFSKANLDNPENSDRALASVPLMMGKLFPTGLLGVVMAGLMAAHMSVHDSYLLAWATVISQDIIGPLRKHKPLTDAQNIWVTRVAVVLIATFLITWGIWYPLPKSVWTYMAITGTIYVSGAVAALVGGMYWKAASSTGALLALLGGLFAVLALDPVRNGILGALGQDPAHTFWYSDRTVGLGTFVVSILLFVVGSVLFPDRKKTEEGIHA
ncbi:MAG: sodium:solute symporter family protein [Planctomycetota bacterium]